MQREVVDMEEFRTLRADEIDVRVQSVKKGKNVGAITFAI